MDQEKKSKIKGVITFMSAILLMVSIISTLVILDYEKLTKCQDLGYDAKAIASGESVCIKQLHYNPFEGDYVYCQMPIHFGERAKEWCKE